ncbi:MAG: hypothetical protein DWH79_11400 [Planctomycetota bacterium]|nr:MAG: hypothetical protein DWH79_11400 [Planctomycetota bacterium]
MNSRRALSRTMQAGDESTESEIAIGADGRVHIFGASREILEALAAIGVRGDAVAQRLGRGLVAACGTPQGASPPPQRSLPDCSDAGESP